MKNLIKSSPTGLIAGFLICAAVLMVSTDAEAKKKVVPIKGMEYKVNASMADNLKALEGQKVSVTLNSGKTYGGIIKAVGQHLLHLEKIAGKDFSDALIRIDKIGAIDAKFREMQR